jgi:hypothetical protein
VSKVFLVSLHFGRMDCPMLVDHMHYDLDLLAVVALRHLLRFITGPYRTTGRHEGFTTGQNGSI